MDNRKMEHTPRKYFRCGSEDHLMEKNIRSHQKISRNGESKYGLMKKAIVNATTAKITMTKRYIHLWHICLVMTNVLVEILVTVSNRPIGFYIMEQRVT